MKCIHGVSMRSPCPECDGYKPVVPPAVAEFTVKERQVLLQQLERLAGIIAEVVTVSGIHVPDDANLGPGPDICSLGDEAVRKLKQPSARVAKPIGYINKKDLARLQDEITWDGSYLTIGVDHFAQWLEDTPYEHLAPIYAAPPADAELVALRGALKRCVASLDQLLPYLGKVPADVGLLNDALVAARPLIADK